jgi:transposase
MVTLTFNHIQGKNGSHWNRLMREEKAEEYCIVAIDAAKYVNTAMVCTIYGDILQDPFEFDGSMTGFQLLEKHIDMTCEAYSLSQVIIGIETTAHYYEDLVRLCMDKEYIVRILNAATTARERETVLNYTKTDRVDLMAIVQSILHGRGGTSVESLLELESLKTLTRARRALVNTRTKIINHLRLYMDHIFREFQGKNLKVDGVNKVTKILDQFVSKTSLFLMRNHPHPSDILALGKVGLREISIKSNLKLREDVIDRLLDYAANSISKPKSMLESELILLQLKLDEYELINRQIKELEDVIEEKLLKTDGGILLSVPGIGVTTAAELTAEIGNLHDFSHAGQLIKMAGTNPIVRQSGGKRANHYRISKQGRAAFRSVVYQVGKNVSNQNPEMKAHYLAMKDKGKKPGQAYIALGNRILRIAFAMIKSRRLYKSSQPDYCLEKIIAGKLKNIEKQKLFNQRFLDIEDL